MVTPIPIMAKYYSLVPYPEGIFEGMDAISRVTFGIIWERWKLSSYNVLGTAGDCRWYDRDEEEVYCLFNQLELARLVGCSEKTIRRTLIYLHDEKHLIYWRKADYKGVCRYYVEKDVQRYMNSLKQNSRKQASCQ